MSHSISQKALRLGLSVDEIRTNVTTITPLELKDVDDSNILALFDYATTDKEGNKIVIEDDSRADIVESEARINLKNHNCIYEFPFGILNLELENLIKIIEPQQKLKDSGFRFYISINDEASEEIDYLISNRNPWNNSIKILYTDNPTDDSRDQNHPKELIAKLIIKNDTTTESYAFENSLESLLDTITSKLKTSN